MVSLLGYDLSILHEIASLQYFNFPRVGDCILRIRLEDRLPALQDWDRGVQVDPWGYINL